MTTMEEKRLAKQAAWRAAHGLPPNGERMDHAQSIRAFGARKSRKAARLWSDTVRDPLDERDNLGESPDY